MRTTIDLPDELFREAKVQAVQEGTTLKELLTGFIRAGLGRQTITATSGATRRSAPLVAIRRVSGQARVAGRSNRELNEIIEEQEVDACKAIKRTPKAQA